MLLAGSASGATVAVHVARNGDPSPLDVRLGLLRDDRQPSWIATRHLQPDRSDITFRDVAAGSYALLLGGPRPLERASAHVVVGTDDHRTVTIAIQPRSFHGRFTMGGTPLANATLTVQAADFTTSATTDARGVIIEPLWQGGDVRLTIDSPRLGAPYPAQVRLTGHLVLDIESRVVRGVVRGTNGEPVAGASIVLRAEGEDRRVPRRTTTNNKGEFRIDGVRPGSQSLRVSASGYLRGKPIEFQIAEREHVENVVLDPGLGSSIEVVDAGGHAIPGVTVVCATGNSIRSITRTDVLGHALVATPRDGNAMLFAGLVAQRAARSGRIVIPPGSASLQLELLVTDGMPLTDLPLLVRYNGAIIPPEVARVFGIQQRTDARGRAVLSHVPPGVYELWPYRSDEEAEALMASESVLAAPIKLDVASGEYRATVRFKAR